MSTLGSNLLDTIVGELTLLDGRRQSDVFHMAALTPPRRAHADRRRETLFVFLDLSGRGSNGLARAMLERFNRVYWRRPGTVTSVLRQAIGAANAHMLEENRLSPVSQRRRGGIVCAVLRDDNLYLAQIGPAKVLLAQGERLVQLSPASERPSDGGGASEVAPDPGVQPQRLPLGVSSGLDIHFVHRYLNTGDRLLLTGQRWSEGLSDEALSAALGVGGGAEEILLALERQIGTGTASALIVECVSSVYSFTSAPAAEQHQRLQPSGELNADETAPSRASVRETQIRERWRPANPLSDIFTGTRNFDRVISGLRQAAMTLSDGARTMLTRVLPEPEPAPRRRRRRPGTENAPMMAFIAFAIPLLVAFVVVTFYLQRSAVARRESLAKQARSAVQAAREAEDEAARARWDAAWQASQAALAAAPDEAELEALRDEARSQLDALDGVVRPDLIEVWNYGPGADRRLAATRLQLYVLDPAQHQVTQHTLDQDHQDMSNGQPNLVAYQGESVGDEEIGGLRDIVWLEAGGTRANDALLILTDDHQLLQYSLSWGLSWMPLDTGLARIDAHVVRPFGGRLYALDPGQSQVWRFPFTENGFGPPEGYFPAAAPDLSDAVDMAIDGAVYILIGDGRIYKFLAGEAQPYQLTDLPQPLVRPVALVVEGDVSSGALYVADAGAQSIVVLDKSGRFIHQIKPPVSGTGSPENNPLADLEALTIEESSRTLYALAGGRIYALSLPPLPEPADAAD